MQMCCCIFNVIIFILSSSAFCSKHSTAVNLFKIAVGKFIPLFGIFILFGTCPAWIYTAADATSYDLYLVTDIDVPWVEAWAGSWSRG